MFRLFLYNVIKYMKKLLRYDSIASYPLAFWLDSVCLRRHGPEDVAEDSPKKLPP